VADQRIYSSFGAGWLESASPWERAYAPGIRHLLDCRQLRSLTLMGCVDVDDRCVFGISMGCPNLRNFELSPAWTVAAAPIHALATRCRRLESLSLHLWGELCDGVVSSSWSAYENAGLAPTAYDAMMALAACPAEGYIRSRRCHAQPRLCVPNAALYLRRW
jgi:hypothetical protein